MVGEATHKCEKYTFLFVGKEAAAIKLGPVSDVPRIGDQDDLVHLLSAKLKK